MGADEDGADGKKGPSGSVEARGIGLTHEVLAKALLWPLPEALLVIHIRDKTLLLVIVEDGDETRMGAEDVCLSGVTMSILLQTVLLWIVLKALSA